VMMCGTGVPKALNSLHQYDIASSPSGIWCSRNLIQDLAAERTRDLRPHMAGRFGSWMKSSYKKASIF
jgi:hypothetical protein